MAKADEKPDKLRAEWFWCDRWAQSSAKAMSIAHRGLYREMLTAAWSLGGRLPADHAEIRRLVGVDAREWKALWPKVAPYWRVDGEHLVNDTQLEVYAEAVRQRDAASNRGRAGAAARHGARVGAQAGAQASTQVVAQVVTQGVPSVSVSEPVSAQNAETAARTPGPRPTVASRARALGFVSPAQFDRLHGTHVFQGLLCGEDGFVCLPESLYDGWVRRLTTAGHSIEAAKAKIRAFVEAVKVRYRASKDVPGDDEFAFWRNEWARANTSNRPTSEAAPSTSGYRSAADIIAEQDRIAATIPDRTLAEVQAITRGRR